MKDYHLHDISILLSSNRLPSLSFNSSLIFGAYHLRKGEAKLSAEIEEELKEEGGGQCLAIRHHTSDGILF